ncbi:MAG TPA: DUF1064 domain-containing protein [bacterium]|nr:DUF1064 domain-containing protein [bacterium]
MGLRKAKNEVPWTGRRALVIPRFSPDRVVKVEACQGGYVADDNGQPMLLEAGGRVAGTLARWVPVSGLAGRGAGGPRVPPGRRPGPAVAGPGGHVMPTVKADAATIREWEDKGLIPRQTSGPVTTETPKRKYRNEPITFEGFTFDSKKELRRWLDLREQQRAGQVKGLQRQVSFPIEVNGHLVCEYVADFVYVRDGVFVVEDVKSEVTRKQPVYRLKAKLMAALGMPVTEV